MAHVQESPAPDDKVAAIEADAANPQPADTGNEAVDKSASSPDRDHNEKAINLGRGTKSREERMDRVENLLLELRDVLGHYKQPSPQEATAELRSGKDLKAPQRPEFGEIGDYWSHLDKSVKERSDRMIKALKDNLDNLLIFAALFSAVNSGFLAFSIPLLTPNDPSDETNHLLRMLVQRADNATLTQADLRPPPAEVTAIAIVTNTLFSLSLALSLLSAFGALLGQQWIIYYGRPTAYAKDGIGLEAARKLHGAEEWKLSVVLELVLPTILQIAVIVFMVGFVVFLYHLNRIVAIANLAFSGLGGLGFLAITCLASWDPFCPFQTPISSFLRTLLPAPDQCKPKVRSQRDPHRMPYVATKFIEYDFETSGNSTLLLAHARNIQVLRPHELCISISENPRVLTRLLEMWQQTTDTDEKLAYIGAYCHLSLLAGLSSENDGWLRSHSYFYSVWYNCTESRSTDISSLLISVSTTAALYALNPDQFEFSAVLQCLQDSAEPQYALGMVTWSILSAAGYLLNQHGDELASWSAAPEPGPFQLPWKVVARHAALAYRSLLTGGEETPQSWFRMLLKNYQPNDESPSGPISSLLITISRHSTLKWACCNDSQTAARLLEIAAQLHDIQTQEGFAEAHEAGLTTSIFTILDSTHFDTSILFSVDTLSEFRSAVEMTIKLANLVLRYRAEGEHLAPSWLEPLMESALVWLRNRAGVDDSSLKEAGEAVYKKLQAAGVLPVEEDVPQGAFRGPWEWVQSRPLSTLSSS